MDIKVNLILPNSNIFRFEFLDKQYIPAISSNVPIREALADVRLNPFPLAMNVLIEIKKETMITVFAVDF